MKERFAAILGRVKGLLDREEGQAAVEYAIELLRRIGGDAGRAQDESVAGEAVEPLPHVNPSGMKKLVLVGLDGRVICEVCHLANRPHTRIRGGIGWKRLHRGEGLLLRPACLIHTAFARFPIDAVFLDSEMTVLGIAHELMPWRLAGSLRARAILELAAGECKRLGVRSRDRLGWGMI